MMRFFVRAAAVWALALVVYPVWGQQNVGCDGFVVLKAGRSGPCTELAREIAGLVEEPAVARAHWGISVAGMDGAPIYSLNDGQLFQPASNAKLFTTAAAVYLLGTGRRFTTVLEGPAISSVDGVLKGDLILNGYGDANFAGSEVPYVEPAERTRQPVAEVPPLRDLEQMADAVAAAGVKHITGDIVGFDNYFPWQPYAMDWAQDDLVWGYGAPVSGLSVNDNQLRLTVTPGAAVGEPASVVLDPAVPYYEVQASVKTVARKSESAVQVEREPGSKVLRVYGAIALGAGSDVEEVAIEDPVEFAAVALKGMLEARGIVVDGRPRAKHQRSTETRGFRTQVMEPLTNLPNKAFGQVSQLVTGRGVCFDACPFRIEHTSPTVLEDIVATNKESLNLHAELLLRQLGRAYGSEGSTAQGARVVRAFLEGSGIDKDDFVFYDGSGLSGHDLVTPRATVRLLAYASGQPWFADWKSSLPVGGVDGSLERRFTKAPLKGKVFAKTGTLGEARALSGYVECASGRTVIFSIMVGNHLPGSSADREVMDQIVGAIAAAN
jgi:D-alanyl-D-alanine carboxypeptidase/D-alanyl-D-alanine-endopeptidase (penicillin-binding protein 4)